VNGFNLVVVVMVVVVAVVVVESNKLQTSINVDYRPHRQLCGATTTITTCRQMC